MKKELKKIIRDIFRYITDIPIAYFFSLDKDMSVRRLERKRYDSYSRAKYSELLELRKSTPSISAIIRVKNGESNLETTIRSVLPICNQIVIVDNNSQDRTLELAYSLKEKYAHTCCINIYQYNEELAPAGDGYIEYVKNRPSSSLAKYYNFCFSKGISDYLWKVDVNCIYLPSILADIQLSLSKGVDIISYFGIESTGRYLSHESSIFKRDLDWKYIDSDLYEILDISNGDCKYSYMNKPFFFHIKRLYCE